MGPRMPDDGGDYSSIDPAALKGAIASLQKSVDGVNTYISGLASDFAYFGIDGNNLTTLQKAASAISPLLPELRRRQSMAEQLVAESPQNGKVAYFQGDLLGQFKTVAAAQAQAHIDAELVKNATDHGHNIPQGVYDDLGKYGDDPDYAAAFVNDLGPKCTSYLLLHVEHFDSDRKPDQTELAAVAATFATASYRVNFDEKYLTDLEQATGDLGVGINPLKIFTPLLRTGTWSRQSLENIADDAFWGPVYNDGPIGDLDDQTVDNIFKGLADNPLAAADYYAKHQKQMYDLGNSKLPVQPTMSYLDFLHAATIDARSLYTVWGLNGGPKRNLAEVNANFLVNQVGQDGDQSHGLLEKTYADIGVEYFDDYVSSLMSPVDVSGMQASDGGSAAPWLAVNASEDAWKKLFSIGMTNDEGLVELTGVFTSSVQDLNARLNQQTVDGQQAGTNTTPYTNPANATAWLAYARYELQADFKGSLDAASSSIDKDWHDRLDGMTSAISTGLDWITDPKGIPSDLEGMATGAVKDWLSGTIAGLLAGKEPPLPSQKVKIDGSALDLEENYANDAIGQYNDGLRVNPKHPFMDSYNDGTTVWDGNPSLYNDPAHSFVNGDGTVKALSQIEKDPVAMQNFIQWLEDPNVQAHVVRNSGRPG